MPVINSLAMDHFYIALPQESFSNYISFFKALHGTHSIVNSGSNSWEGLYLSSRLGDYFEIVKSEPPGGGLGLALSAISPTYQETKKIIQELPAIEWNTGSRVDHENRPWFDWASPVAYEEHNKVIFNTWIMDYHKAHWDFPKPFSTRYVDCWKKIEVEIGTNHLDEIKLAASALQWKKDFGKEVIKLSVPRRDCFEFELEIKLVDGVRFKPVGDRTGTGCGVQYLIN